MPLAIALWRLASLGYVWYRNNLAALRRNYSSWFGHNHLQQKSQGWAAIGLPGYPLAAARLPVQHLGQEVGDFH